ncbi:signal peptidase I [Chloroflexota bacterium]
MKKLAVYLGSSLLIILMMFAVSIYAGPHIGWRVDAVLSGSMAPEVKVGSLVITRFVDSEEIAVGDIITFHPNLAEPKLITHRVVAIGHNSPLYFQTKGDANQYTDPFKVPERNLVGKVILHIPYWGHFTEFLKTHLGFLSSVVIPGVIVIALYTISVWREISRNRKQRLDKVVVQ